MRWNTLDVPIRPGWQCTLHPANQVPDLMRSLSWENADGLSHEHGAIFRASDSRDEKERARRQLERDKSDFARYFCASWDLRTASGSYRLSVIRSFLRDTLDFAHWNLPRNKATIERILRDLVMSGRLVPIVNRDWRTLGRVSRPAPVPEWLRRQRSCRRLGLS